MQPAHGHASLSEPAGNGQLTLVIARLPEAEDWRPPAPASSALAPAP